MKERIYTIPVNDAFAHEGGCALCRMRRKLSDDLTAYYLGPSLMEPDVRVATNAEGFCREHAAMLYNRRENRLGLALMYHTHAVATFDEAKEALARAAQAPAPAGLLRRVRDAAKGGGSGKEALLEAAARLEARTASCAMCGRIAFTMDRYVDVILWQYFEEKEFRTRFHACGGFCLPHAAELLRGAAKHLSAERAAHFAQALAHATGEALDREADDLEGFTRMFDHRNAGQPASAHRDALPNAIRRLEGDAPLQ